jgi:hypothetical protein
LNVFDILDRIHLSYGRDFVLVYFGTAFSDDVPQVLPLGDSEGAFFWVPLDVEPLEVVEVFFQIKDEAITLF